MQDIPALCTKSYTLFWHVLMFFAPGQHGKLGKEGIDACRTFCPDAAAVCLHDGLRDGKAKPKAAVARPRGIGAGKAVKDLPQRLRRQRRALVRDGQAAAALPIPRQADGDRAAGGVFPGVVKINLHQLAELPLVAADGDIRF